MSASVESRVPFLTAELYEHFASLPDEYLISPDGTTKHVFREAMRGIVPDAILDRRDKIGFRSPEAKWLRRIAPWAESILGGETARSLPYFRHDVLLRDWHRALAEPGRYNPWFWRCLNLIRWAERIDATA
jgi:asparagine synthase (glutamine-hydrolysing)